MSKQRETLNRGWLALADKNTQMGFTDDTMRAVSRIVPPVTRTTRNRWYQRSESTRERLFEESLTYLESDYDM
ncbi:MAG TPA: hypothetical protein VLF89_09740 [Candidatus Saccharimonadales bacterium]|nr:hypothetical protein [Candidatus Saccharimonadales bacterium]